MSTTGRSYCPKIQEIIWIPASMKFLPIWIAGKQECIKFCGLLITGKDAQSQDFHPDFHPIYKTKQKKIEPWPELEVDAQQSCAADMLQASLQKLLLPPCCSVNNFQGCQLASSFALLTDVPEKPCILGPFSWHNLWNECSVILN